MATGIGAMVIPGRTTEAMAIDSVLIQRPTGRHLRIRWWLAWRWMAPSPSPSLAVYLSKGRLGDLQRARLKKMPSRRQEPRQGGGMPLGHKAHSYSLRRKPCLLGGFPSKPGCGTASENIAGRHLPRSAGSPARSASRGAPPISRFSLLAQPLVEGRYAIRKIERRVSRTVVTQEV